jgi:hypothetical protein
MMHSASRPLGKCAICGAQEPASGAFPTVVGVGRVCMADGMKKVKCEACGTEVKLLTSSKLQGRTLCLSDHMKEVERFRQHVVVTFDEDAQPAGEILTKAYSGAPEGYTLLAVRRGRNSTHLWEAEYEKTEVFQMRCS